jgi:hypothetical protein
MRSEMQGLETSAEFESMLKTLGVAGGPITLNEGLKGFKEAAVAEGNLDVLTPADAKILKGSAFTKQVQETLLQKSREQAAAKAKPISNCNTPPSSPNWNNARSSSCNPIVLDSLSATPPRTPPCSRDRGRRNTDSSPSPRGNRRRLSFSPEKKMKNPPEEEEIPLSRKRKCPPPDGEAEESLDQRISTLEGKIKSDQEELANLKARHHHENKIEALLVEYATLNSLSNVESRTLLALLLKKDDKK